MMGPRLCPFCGSRGDACAECEQPREGIAWRAEPRGWSAARAIGEGALVLLPCALFALPLGHALAAALILMSRGDSFFARVVVSAVILVMAAAEVSLIRGLLERVLRRWARKWTFEASRDAVGAGWVRVVPTLGASRALSGYGSIRAENGTQYKWMADFEKGVHKKTRAHA